GGSDRRHDGVVGGRVERHAERMSSKKLDSVIGGHGIPYHGLGSSEIMMLWTTTSAPHKQTNQGWRWPSHCTRDSVIGLPHTGHGGRMGRSSLVISNLATTASPEPEPCDGAWSP